VNNGFWSRAVHRRTLLLRGIAATATIAAAGRFGSAAGAADDATPAVTEGTVRLRMETGPGKDVAEVVTAFMSEVPGIQVEFTQVDPASAGTQWARLAIDSGLVDLVSIENPKFLFLDPMLRAGVLSPLDEYGAQYSWSKVMVPAALKRSSRSGQLWTLPLYYELCGVAYRKSVLEAAGAAVPATWEEFVALLTTFQGKGLIPLTVGHRGFSQVQMLHNQLWASIGGPDGIGKLIFGAGKWTDDAPVKAAQAIVDLYNQGLLDKDTLSITQDDAAERFLGGEAAMHVTGTWFYSEMERNFPGDWDMMTVPGPGGAPVWCTGETEAMSIPTNSQDPAASARFLDYCVSGNGAKILRQLGNVLATTAFGDLAIPQVQHLPVVTGDPSALLIFGWLPQQTQDAWQQGLGGILQGVPVEEWVGEVQQAWEQDIENGEVPADRATIQ
jgi:raffinose/stachyose/melibiose transport system substrate-binding protein